MRKLNADEVIKRGDFFVDDEGNRHEMDSAGRILGVMVVGKTVSKAWLFFRPNAEVGGPTVKGGSPE